MDYLTGLFNGNWSSLPKSLTFPIFWSFIKGIDIKVEFTLSFICSQKTLFLYSWILFEISMSFAKIYLNHLTKRVQRLKTWSHIKVLSEFTQQKRRLIFLSVSRDMAFISRIFWDFIYGQGQFKPIVLNSYWIRIYSMKLNSKIYIKTKTKTLFDILSLWSKTIVFIQNSIFVFLETNPRIAMNSGKA